MLGLVGNNAYGGHKLHVLAAKVYRRLLQLVQHFPVHKLYGFFCKPLRYKGKPLHARCVFKVERVVRNNVVRYILIPNVPGAVRLPSV